MARPHGPLGRPFLVVAASLSLLVGCGGGTPDGPAASAPSASGTSGTASPADNPTDSPTAASGTPSASGSSLRGDGGAPADETPVSTPTANIRREGTGAVPFPADQGQDTAQASGQPLTLVDVRIGRQQGYDRVVYELAGDGKPGWFVDYDADPREQGSGRPVEVAGDATLRVALTGVGLPFDTGRQEYDGPRRLRPQGTDTVREVLLNSQFEGQYESFIGLTGRVPFRVFRLERPPRVVVDLRDASTGATPKSTGSGSR